MSRLAVILFIAIQVLVFHPPAVAQHKADSLTDEVKSKINNTFRYFTFGFYIDTYINITLDNKRDTSNLIPFSSNCPVRDQIRMNHAALEVYYNADKVRGKLALQYGDAPNLLATANAQFIKTIRQANFGFRIIKNLWIDMGYLFNPVGYESSWVVINQISTVTIDGYYSFGNVLGIKLSYKFNEKFSGGIIAGDPYTLAHEQNNRLGGIVFFTYKPIPNLSLTYNILFGNAALRTSDLKETGVYNNLIVTYNPIPKIGLVGQFDCAFRKNLSMPPDTMKVGGMFSGFVQARYTFSDHFAITTRYEFFNDRNGLLSDLYFYEGKIRGLLTNGYALEFEFKPVKFGYIRAEYKYIQADKGNNVFYSNTSDHMNALIFTAGVRF